MRQPQQSTPLGGWGPSCSGAPIWGYDNRSSIFTSAPGFSPNGPDTFENTRHDRKHDKGVLMLMKHLLNQPTTTRKSLFCLSLKNSWIKVINGSFMYVEGLFIHNTNKAHRASKFNIYCALTYCQQHITGNKRIQ